MLDDVISIINGCLAGNEDSWGIFVKEFASIAMNVLNSKFSTFEIQEKEDVIQNVFIKFLQAGLKDFRGTSKYEFLSYFATIVRNEAISYSTSKRRKNNTVSLDQEKDGDEAQLPHIEIPEEKLRPDIIVERKEILDLISKVLKDYPLEDQQVFLMKVEGYKDREIAAILRISSGTVASKYSRIKDRVRQALGE